MQKLLCATGNKVKFDIGKHLVAKYDIELVQTAVDIDEIQSEDIEQIIKDKAAKAFTALGQPVIVSDDSWTIPGLNGFPGPYMKSINHWFTPEDLLRLTSELEDRRIYLNQLLAYQDEHEVVIFRDDIPGALQREARGKFGPPIMKVVSLDVDNGLTISETYDAGLEHDELRLQNRSGAWQAFGKWYKEKNS